MNFLHIKVNFYILKCKFYTLNCTKEKGKNVARTHLHTQQRTKYSGEVCN